MTVHAANVLDNLLFYCQQLMNPKCSFSRLVMLLFHAGITCRRHVHFFAGNVIIYGPVMLCN